MYHQEFYTFLKIEPRFLQLQWSFRVLKSLPGLVRDYLFTVTVRIIFKASFLAVLKKLKLQKGEKRFETKDAQFRLTMKNV